MCDEHTESENAAWMARQGIGRREFGQLGAAVSAAMLLPACAQGETSASGQIAVASREVTISTANGSADAFFVTPEKGRHPAIILWPDIAGLREAYRVMGTRLAQAGYAVLVVNQYYRSAKAPILNSLSEWRTDEGQAKLKPMIAAITPAGTSSDAAAFVDWLGSQPEVDTKRKIGTSGYCMGGPFTLRTAAARPDRVGALASFHGGNLVNDTPDSPHLLLPKMKAALLVAIAQNDDAREPATKETLREAAKAAGRKAEIEVYPAQHGWCTIDAPVYDRQAAEKAWDRMLATFQQYL